MSHNLHWNVSELTDRQREMLSAEDKKALGKEAQTQREANARGEARSEKALQRDCINLLRLRGIEPIVSRMDKKTSNNLGTPDLIFAVIGHDGHRDRIWACAVEIKLPGKHLNIHQRVMRKAMTSHPNHWLCRTITSVSEMKMFLEGLGL